MTTKAPDGNFEVYHNEGGPLDLNELNEAAMELQGAIKELRNKNNFG